MQITLYNLPCLPNELNKQYYISKTDTPKLSLTGTLREQCSLQNPSILLQQSITAIKNYNYVSIPSFDRYYFISEVVAVRDGLTRIELSCDVLSSFRNKIVSSDSRLFCERWSGSENAQLEDNLRDYNCNRQVQEIKVSTITTSGETLNDWESTSLDYNIVVTFLSRTSDPLLAVQLTQPKYLNLIVPDTPSSMVSSNSSVLTYCFDRTSLSHLITEAINNANIANAILDIRVYPFNVNHTSDIITTLNLGGENISFADSIYEGHRPHRAFPLTYKLADFTLPGLSTEGQITYLDYKTSYQLWLPFDKWIDLDLNLIGRNRIQVFYQVNLLSGQCNIYVISITGKLLYTNCVSISTEVPITTSNAQSIRDGYIQMSLGVVTGGISTAVGALTANPFMISSGGMEMAKTAVKLVSMPFTTHPTMSCSVPNGNSGDFSARHVRLRTTYYVPVIQDEDSTEWANYKAQYGLPYQTPITGDFLTTNLGTYYFGDCQINFDGATKGEIDQVKSILRNGITITNII